MANPNSGMLIQIPKCILQDAKVIPAKDRFPAKSQVKVSCGFDFYLSSAEIDFETFPLLEPVEVTAHVSRIGGGKGFFVYETNAVEVKPLMVTKEATTQKVKA